MADSEKKLYVTVRIIDVPLHADKPYEYYVPPELEDSVLPGTVVSVPFGRGNRKTAAVVCGTSDVCSCPNPTAVKPIFGASADTGLLDAKALELCEFLCSYTLCTFGEAVRTVIPPAALSKVDEYYTAADTAEPPQDMLNEKAAMVYTYIKARSAAGVTPEKLVSKFGEEAAELAASLIKLGMLQKNVRVREATNNRYTVYAQIADGKAREADEAQRTVRSPLQAQILAVLRANGRMETSELYARIGKKAQAQLASLEEKGLVTLEKIETYRNPYLACAKADGGANVLSEGQKAAFDKMNALYSEGKPAAALLHGITGSGKTRVIKAMIDRVISDGKGVIMLVPEIALTPQTVGYFCGCFGDRVAVIHSNLSQGERYDAWKRVRRGDADIVIGTRSAIFAPVKNLGMIVIDEEQEHTYKSDTDPKYLAHDVARFRCGKTGAFMLLSSATPSLGSYYKAVRGIYTLVELNERYGGAKLPEVVISDMRSEAQAGNTSPIGSVLRGELERVYKDGKQSIVFLNRRGYSNTVSCRICGEAIKCPHCSVSLTYHTRRPLGTDSADAPQYLARRREYGILACHYCGYRARVPEKCPFCGAEHFKYMGCGTQQVQEELERLLPGARVLRMDADTTQTKNAHGEILRRFRNGEGDILLGTQMVTKGHDFPHVTLVGVINADQSLYLDDYRAEEKTFSMLTQVIGRAGRADDAGMAVIQTSNPSSEVIKLAAAQDYKGFYKGAIQLRRSLVFPPFCDLAVLTLSASDEALLSSSAVRLSDRTRELLQKDFADTEAVIFGPFEAPVYKIQNVCRMRLVIKCRLNRRTREFIKTVLCEFGREAKKVNITADFNPSVL